MSKRRCGFVRTYLDDVDARDLLRDGVLHLHAGVHLMSWFHGDMMMSIAVEMDLRPDWSINETIPAPNKLGLSSMK